MENPTMRGLAHLPVELTLSGPGTAGNDTTMSIAATSESRENS
jgi:hypothetical protein